MTTLLPTPCAQPGCPAIGRERYCPIHARAARRREDQNRPSPALRGYDARWRRIRAVFLATHRICGQCSKAQATEVDHIIPLSQGGTDADSNLRARCKSCHSRRTMRDQGRGSQIPAIPSLYRVDNRVCAPSVKNPRENSR